MVGPLICGLKDCSKAKTTIFLFETGYAIYCRLKKNWLTCSISVPQGCQSWWRTPICGRKKFRPQECILVKTEDLNGADWHTLETEHIFHWTAAEYIYIFIYHIAKQQIVWTWIHKTNAMEYDPELRNAESLGGDALYVFLSLFIAWLAGLLQGSCKRYLGWCLLLSACIRNWAGCQGLDNLTYKEASSLARWVDTGCNML